MVRQHAVRSHGHRAAHHAGRSGVAGYDPPARKPGKPFVVCSSTRSHHAVAHAEHRSSRRAAPSSSTILDERQLTKAAQCYAKNPSDTQALLKLASLHGNARFQGRAGAGSASGLEPEAWAAPSGGSGGGTADPSEGMGIEAYSPGVEPIAGLSSAGGSAAAERATATRVVQHMEETPQPPSVLREQRPPQVQRSARTPSPCPTTLPASSSPSSATAPAAQSPPPPPSPHLGPEVNVQSLLQLGKSGGASWPVARTTWPTPEQRAQVARRTASPPQLIGRAVATHQRDHR